MKRTLPLWIHLTAVGYVIAKPVIGLPYKAVLSAFGFYALVGICQYAIVKHESERAQR